MVDRKNRIVFENVVTGIQSLQAQVRALQKQNESLLVLSKNAKTARTSVNNLNKAGKEFTITWKGVVRVIAGSLVSRGIAGLTNAFRTAYTEARQLNRAIAEIQTISQGAQLSTETWTSALTNLSTEFNLDLLKTAEGTYQALSNQIGQGTEALNFQREAARLAAISASDLDAAVLALSGTINAFGENAKSTEQLVNELFKAVELGRLRIEEIGPTLGRVNVQAAQLGITSSEVLAGIATLSIQGVDAAVAMTQLRNVFQKLIRPTDRLQELFRQWGVETGEQAIAAFGLEGVLRKLDAAIKSTGDASGELGEIFQEVRGILGGAGLTRAIDGFSSNLEQIENSGESAAEALRLFQESTDFKLGTEFKQVQAEFRQLGQSIAENLVQINERLIDFSDTIKFVRENLGLLGGILLAIPVGRFLKGFAAAAGAARNVSLLTAALAGLRATLGRLGVLAGRLLGGSFGALFFLGFAVTNQVIQGFRKVEINYEKLTEKFLLESNKRIEIYKKEVDQLTSESKELEAAISQSLEGTVAAYQAAINELTGLADFQNSAQRDLLDTELEIAKLQGDSAKARRLIVDETKSLFDNLNAIADKEGPITADDRDLANDLVKQISDLASQFDNADKNARKLQQTIRETVRIQESGPDRSGELFGLPQQGAPIPTITSGADLNQLDRQFEAEERQRRRLQREQQVNKANQQQLLVKRQILEVQRRLLGRIKDQADVAEFARQKVQDELDALLTKQKEINSAIQEELDLRKNLTSDAKAFGETQEESLARFRAALEGLTRSLQNEGNIFRAFIDANKALFGSGKVENADALVFFRLLNEAIALAGQGADLTDEQFGRLKTIIEEITQLDQQALKDQISFLPEDFEAQLNVLRSSITALIQARQAGERTKEALEATKRAEEDLRRALENLPKTTTERLRGLIDQQKALGDAGQQLLANLTADMNATITKFEGILQRFITAIREAQAVANTPIEGQRFGGAISRRFGGPLLRQSGGTVGTDTIPALLSPGEFVVNARQARKFLPQLVAMNSGSRRFDTGGQAVTNNNIGDINVSLETTGNEQLDARAVGNAIRRELRRSTLRLN